MITYALAVILCKEFVAVPFKDTYICVAPDYYQEDGVRRSLTVSEALSIAREHNAIIPTAEMVDAIWKHADLKLKPHPLPPGPQMTTESYLRQHNEIVDKQIGDQTFQLIAGHKKDIIQSRKAGRVTIYGWHRLDGRPIQPPSSVHGENYKDYSHGLRLVRLLGKEAQDD